jgi:hypothetical protein
MPGDEKKVLIRFVAGIARFNCPVADSFGMFNIDIPFTIKKDPGKDRHRDFPAHLKRRRQEYDRHDGGMDNVPADKCVCKD